MSWFSEKRKRSDEIKPLSEGEIQKKLYGEFYSSASAVGATQTVEGGRPPDGVRQGRSVTAAEGRRSAEHGPAVETTAGKDLFSGAARRTEKVPVDLPADSDETRKQLERLSVVTEEDLKGGEGRPSRRAKPRFAPRSFLPKVPRVDPSLFRNFFSGVWKITVFVGRHLRNFAVSLVGFFLKILVWFDPRRAVARRFFYGLGAFAALFSIFMSIHVLNVNREKAMRDFPRASPPRPVAQPVAQPKGQAVSAVTGGDEALNPPVPQTETSAVSEGLQEPSAAGAAPKQPYVVQVATYVSRDDAAKVSEQLQQERLPAFVDQLSRAGGRVYYSVFLGRYASSAAAHEGLAQFKKSRASQTFTDAFVRSLG